jgi:glycosyltransferase involved in cell wall biosynthesis
MIHVNNQLLLIFREIGGFIQCSLAGRGAVCMTVMSSVVGGAMVFAGTAATDAADKNARRANLRVPFEKFWAEVHKNTPREMANRQPAPVDNVISTSSRTESGPQRALIRLAAAGSDMDLDPPAERYRLTDLLYSAGLVVLLSDYEAHPVAVVEALSVHRPVLVTDTSGLRELTPERFVPVDSIGRNCRNDR